MKKISTISFLMESHAMLSLILMRRKSAKNEAGFKMNSFTMRIALVIIIFIPYAVSAATNADYERAQKLREMGHHALVIEILTPLAHRGHVDAQIMLSDMFFVGQGIRQNKNTAIFWACRASESDAIRAHIHRIKLSLKASSQNYQPPNCEEIKKEN